MLRALGRALQLLVLAAALFGMSLSALALFLPGMLGGDAEQENLGHMASWSGFELEPLGQSAPPEDSPHTLNITVHTPPLLEGDELFIEVYTGGARRYVIDCLSGFDGASEYAGGVELACGAYLPYDYSPSGSYRLFGVLKRGDAEYVTPPATVGADWAAYEGRFLGFSLVMAAALAGLYLLILLPVAYLVLRTASGAKHRTILPGEYSLRTLLFPLEAGKTVMEKLQSVLVSPYFWAFEILCIAVIILYIAVSAQVWRSWTAVASFAFSGMMALAIPFLWCAAWWYADYREREPLRILVTFFLWGMMAALMAIGINSVSDAALGLAGLGILGTFLIAPVVEEFYKGGGLALLSEHHEFDGVEDGFVFGFTIGMGFAFVENWIYLMANPLSSDILGWTVLFFLRSILFSANHGLYTAITGGVIGWLLERKARGAGLGLLIGFPIAAVFHAIHNSAEALDALIGDAGTLLYCCFLIPLFDYGGLVLLVLLFVRALLKKSGQW